MGDHVLDFARVLGGGKDGDLVVLAGNGEGDMAFEIEMFLAADAHPAASGGAAPLAMRRLGVAALERQRLGDEGVAASMAPATSVRRAGRRR